MMLSVTLPDGTVATRRTQHDYTHVVAIHDTDPDSYWNRRLEVPEHWAAWSWHRREDLAVKERNKVLKFRYADVRILEVPR